MRNTWKHAKFWPFIACSLLAHLAVALAGNVVPVMLWYGESSSSLVNPLHKTSKPEFEKILAEQSKNQPPIIVFIKDNFCAEDIKSHQEKLKLLNNAGSLTYLTSVESPLSVFENLSSYNVTMEDDLESVAEGQLALVQITDLNAIPEIYNMVRESTSNLMVALTAKSCGYTSFERVKRQTSISNDTKPFIIKENGILFYASKAPFIKYNNEEYVQLESPVSTNATKTNDTYYLSMTFNNVKKDGSITLTAPFHIIQGYFEFLGISYDNGTNKPTFLKSKNDIYFPFNFSYHCAQNITFASKDKDNQISLKILNLQVQMDPKGDRFSDAYDCVGFMSIPIWTGIFVTTILAIIMFWGLTMIMDIRTMDRFDDPKGKTITISAQE